MKVEVRRSVVVPFLAAAFAIVALVAAIDMTFTYRLFDEPEKNDDGTEFTSQGRSERRADITWGLGLAVGSGVLLAWALPQIYRDHSVLEADEEGVALRIGPANTEPWRVSWDIVSEVRSVTIDGELGREHSLALRLEPGTELPGDLRGADLQGDELFVAAGDWRPPVQDVVGRLKILLDRSGTTPG